MACYIFGADSLKLQDSALTKNEERFLGVSALPVLIKPSASSQGLKSFCLLCLKSSHDSFSSPLCMKRGNYVTSSPDLTMRGLFLEPLNCEVCHVFCNSYYYGEDLNVTCHSHNLLL